MEDNHQTSEDSQQTMGENHQIMEDNHQTLDYSQQTMGRNQKIMEDSQQTMDYSQQTIWGNQQPIIEDNKQKNEDNLQILQKYQQTMENIQQLNNSVYPCDECGKIFSEKEKLRNHKSYTHRIEVSVCQICGSEFQNKQKLQKHINARHKDKGLHCDQCTKVFKNNSDLYGHKKKVHEVIENLACDKCGIKMMNTFKLKRHLRKWCPGYKHTQDNLNCIECNKTFESIKALNGHNKFAHTYDPIHSYDPIMCPICQKNTKNISYFRQHLTRAHKIIDPNHILALIKDVKPEYEEEIQKKKVSHLSNLSDYQKQRSDLIKKWKEIEKEQNERIGAQKMNSEVDEINKITPEDTNKFASTSNISNHSKFDGMVNFFNGINTNIFHRIPIIKEEAISATIKTENEFEVNPGDFIKCEISDNEDEHTDVVQCKLEVNSDD